MENEAKKRLAWIVLFEKTKDTSEVCRKCGISRPTLYKWLNRYREQGIAGLQSMSRRPKTTPNQKVFEREEQAILELRQARKLGARRITSELKRRFAIELSCSTVGKTLKKMRCKPLQRKPRSKKVKRYSRPIPGQRVQMDIMKVGPGRYQFSAIDDCTRMKVIALYPRKTAKNVLIFLEKVLEELPFPIQVIQTDRGKEFFSYDFQEKLMEYHIKYRPIRPRSPHLNGKVERSQRTDWDEFYSTVDLDSPELESLLEEWQSYYNCDRPHGSLNNQTPWEVWLGLAAQTPWAEEVFAAYDPSKEYIQDQNYYFETRFSH